MLFDTHAHYYDERFAREIDGGADALLPEIFKGGVARIVEVAEDIKTSHICITQAEKYEGMFCAVGIHPSNAGVECNLESARKALTEMLECRRDKKIVAIGEIGFDYHYDDTNPAVQKEFFDMQMSLAKKYSLPVIIHDRDAHGDCFDMARMHDSVQGIFHSFSGSAEMARDLCRRGYYISFSGVVTFKNASRVREVVKAVPSDRLLIETDCPYLAPEPCRGKLNHSMLMKYTAETVAQLRGLSLEELENLTYENSCRVFGI